MFVKLRREMVDRALKPIPFRVWTGSSLEIVIDPGDAVTEPIATMQASVTNADGVTVSAAMSKRSDGCYRAAFGASAFAHYGSVVNGVWVGASFAGDLVPPMTLLVADLVVEASSASAQPGAPGAAYQQRGDDEFIKSYIQSGVQHFKKVQIEYSPEMGDWGFNLVGDYVLVNGEFVEVAQ